jgi:hypothetical protein
MSIPVPKVITTTPPDSFTVPPLTPPPTEEKGRRTSIRHILNEVRNIQRGQSSISPWHQVPLSEDEYTDLLGEVEKESDSFQGFWRHKLKYVRPSQSLTADLDT